MRPILNLQSRCKLLQLLGLLSLRQFAKATIIIESSLNPQLSGTYVRGVELGHEEAFAKSNSSNIWLYKIDYGENGIRWHIGEDIHSGACLALVDSNSPNPCQDAQSGEIYPWMVAIHGEWTEDPAFSIQCRGMEEGALDPCHGVPCMELKGGVQMPVIMLGTAYISKNHVAAAENPEMVESAPAIEAALDLKPLPYQGLDLGSQMHPAYGNEAAVGQMLAARPGRRKEIFITTKLSPSEHGYNSTLRAFQRSLRLLGTDTIDLYLLHHPRCLMADRCEGDWEQSWKAMERIYELGAARAIGVSNFDANLLIYLVGNGKNNPGLAQAPVALLQNRADPLAREDPRVLAICEKHGIIYQPFSVLGRQWVVGTWSPYWKARHPVLAHPDVVALAERVSSARGEKVTPAQVVLRWALQKGWPVVPKTSSPERLDENRRLFFFDLDEDDMQIMDKLERPSSSQQDEL